MNINDKISNFTVLSSERIDEIDATLFELLHEKSGARLLFLKRHDENMTFTVGFKTTPTDDTGVFHIMEHSVLCGSKKFPLKDPMTELIKGSVSTYINALTAGDKTLYPVASKNPRAFFGLVDVYLDAVFNPLALDNPFIFMQEGYRYEIDENDKLTVTGVVYNEMKGVYSTADEYADYLISQRVCPKSTYSYDSGGNPDFIPDLSYEEFKRAHETYYHPSNAVIFLDGDVIIDEILPLIDSYLSVYDRRDVNIAIDNGEPPLTDRGVGYFPIEKEEDPTDKTRIYLCYNSYAHSERERLSALSLVTEALADLNNAPLTRRILDSGLCESFTFYTTRSYSVNSLNVTFIGVKDGKEDELIKIFDDSVNDILGTGIPKDILTSALKRREFTVREADFGTYPAGLVYMRSCIEAAMFGENAQDSLKYEGLLSFLKEKLNTPYYEDTLRAIISSPRAELVLYPDPSFTERKDKEIEARLLDVAAKMSAEDKERLREENERFYEWQQLPDTEEALDCLPTLGIEDLKTEPKVIPTDISEVDGVKIITHPLATGGITYAELYFDVSDADENELHHLRLFTDLMFEWSTEKHNPMEFRNETKSHLGTFYVTLHPTRCKGEDKLYLMLHASCLEGEKENATELIREYLYDTKFDSYDVILKNAKQLYTYSLEGIAARGEMYATMRDAAKHSVMDAMIEHLFGYEYHLFVKDLSEADNERAAAALSRLDSIRNTYFKKERLTLAITGQNSAEYAKSLIRTVKSGADTCTGCTINTLSLCNEGIAAPTTVSFAARTANLGDGLNNGAYALIGSIASLEILWDEIRLKNGAYDTGFFAKHNSGSLGCYSYRDPAPGASVDFFSRISDEIEAFLNTHPDLLKYIIGVIGSADTVSTPRSDGQNATKRHLSGRTHDDVVKRRRECLDATVEELKRLNGLIGEAMKTSTFTVVGPRDSLEAIEGIDKILDI